MSTTVDNRVISMTFDNAAFEKNVKTSMSTLRKMDDQLKSVDSSKGLEKIETASRRIDFHVMSNGLQNVVCHFNALDIAGMQVIRRLTDATINMGKNLVKSFAVDPVKTGFSEYELKMGSVQTIMASTGASLEDVNGYLAELNEYSDKTIYSFADMTSNIGKFTNAGVKLEDAVKAIQGVSNEAAVSGANAQQASHAMYNFAQALSAGSVKLIDWKSIENANMATVEFKNELIKTAEELGTLRKEGDRYVSTTTNLNGKTADAFNATSMFNESLNAQWMTTDVLIKTLGRYADETTDIGKKAFASAQDVKTFSMVMDTLKEAAQSGWAETWETIVGDFEESKRLWTSLSSFFGEIIAKSSEIRNNFLGKIFDSPWEKLTKEISATGIETGKFTDSLVKLAKERGVNVDELLADGKRVSDLVSDGTITGQMIRDTIATITGSVDDVSDSTESVTKKLVNLKEVVDDVRLGRYGNGLDRVKNLTDAGYEYSVVQGMVNKAIAGEAVNYEVMTDAQLEAIGYTDEEIEALRELSKQAADSGSSLNQLIDDIQKPTMGSLIFDSLKNVLTTISAPFKAFKEAWRGVFSINPDNFYGVIEKFHDFTSRLKPSETTVIMLTSTFRNLFEVFKTLGKEASNVLHSVFETFGAIIPDVHLNFSRFLFLINRSLKSFNEWLTTSDFMTGAWTMIQNGLSKVATAIEFFKTSVGNLGGFTGNIVSKVVSAFRKLGDAVSKLFRKNDPKELDADQLVTVLSGSKMDRAIIKVTTLKDSSRNLWEQLKEICATIKGALTGSMDKLNKKFEGATFLDFLNTAALSGIAVAIKKLVDSGKKQPLESIASSFSNFMNTAEKAVKSWQTEVKARTLKEIAIAVAILSASILALSFVKNGDALISGLAVVSGLLAEVVGVLIILDKFDIHGSMASALSIAILAGAIAILAGAMSKLDDFRKWDTTWPSLVAMLSLIAGLTAAMAIMNTVGKPGKMIVMALAISALSGAIKLMTAVFLSLSPDEMMTASVRIGGVMAALVLFVKLVSGSDLKGVATTLLGLGASLLLFAAAIKIYSMFKFTEIMQGLAIVAGGIILLSIAVNLMDNAQLAGVGAALMGMAVAMNLLLYPIFKLSDGTIGWTELAVGLAGVAGGIVALALGIRIMTKSTGSNAGQILAMSVALVAMAGAMRLVAIPIKTLGEMKWTEVALGLGAVLGTFVTFGVVGGILSSMASGLLAVSAAFLMFGASILGIGAGVTLLAAGFATLAAVGAAGAAAFLAAATALLAGMVVLIPAVETFLITSLQSICRIIIATAPDIAAAVTVVVLAMIESARKIIPPLIELLFEMLDTTLKALADHIPSILDSLGRIIVAMLYAIDERLPAFLEKGWEIIKQLIAGLVAKAGELIAKGVETMVELRDKIADKIQELKDKGREAIINFIEGFKEKVNNLYKRGQEINEQIKSGIASKLQDIHDKGAEIISKIKSGIEGAFNKILETGKDIITNVKDGINEKLTDIYNAGKDIINNVINGAKEMISGAISIGEDFVSGIKKGFSNMKSSVVGAAENVGKWIKGGTRRSLDEHSPSKEGAKIGEYFDLGIVQGILKNARTVSDSGEQVGDVLLASLRASISAINDALSDNMDMNPTIRPVLDLTEVQNGARRINGLVQPKRVHVAKVSRDMAGSAARHMNARNPYDNRRLADEIISGMNGRKPDPAPQAGGSMTNTFYIKSDKPKEVADEVSKKLKVQVDRRNAVWGSNVQRAKLKG